MPKTILVVLIGNKERGETNHYQLLQEQTAIDEGRRAGHAVEVVFAPGFDHLRVVRKRLHEATSAPLDAVLVEPASVELHRSDPEGAPGARGPGPDERLE